MSTPKEIFLELIRPDGQPERQLRQYEALHMCLTDPCNTYLRGNRKRGTTSVDRWGTTILFPEDAPGPMPDTREGLAVCPDITRWRETVHAPDLEAACTEGWETCRAEARAACGPDHLLAGFMGTGIFEQCHFLMGFEDTLTNLYAHPDEMHALIDYITEYRLTYVRMLIDNLQPDVIFSHDDWGTKNALFMKPEMWREFFKEPYRRFYGYIRSRGVIAIHHADSYLVPIVDDMAEIGIQVWQGVLPENDIPALQAHLNGRLTLMGGFGAAIDRKDATPEDILTYARDVLRRNCPGGHYIPSITETKPSIRARCSIFTGRNFRVSILCFNATLRKCAFRRLLSAILKLPSLIMPSNSRITGARFSPCHTSSVWKPAAFKSSIRYCAL